MATKSGTKATPKKATGPQRVGGRAGSAGKAEGEAPVKAFIASLPEWQRALAKRFDAIVAREVPGVRRAVKWSVPFYGLEGQGWFASFGAFSKHVKILFFKGALLKPPPPVASQGKSGGGALDLRETDHFDEKQIADWVRQASRIPGWGG